MLAIDKDLSEYLRWLSLIRWDNAGGLRFAYSPLHISVFKPGEAEPEQYRVADVSEGYDESTGSFPYVFTVVPIDRVGMSELRLNWEDNPLMVRNILRSGDIQIIFDNEEIWMMEHTDF